MFYLHGRRIIIGRTEDEHLDNLRGVFDACRDKNLKLNPEKADFLDPK